MENQGLNYYQRNKTKILERQKKYNKEQHQQECIDRNKKYYNKDYFREYYHKKR